VICSFQGRTGEGPCRRQAEPDGLMCPEHARYFAQIKKQLTIEGQLRVRKKSGRAPTCCRQGCDHPRLRGEAFCDQCQEAGYVEERE
jgi:hypothetical protein